MLNTADFDVEMRAVPTGVVYQLAGGSGKVYKGGNAKTATSNIIATKSITARGMLNHAVKGVDRTNKPKQRRSVEQIKRVGTLDRNLNAPVLKS